MPHTGGDGEKEPLMQPRVVKALKNRPRLVDFGVRKQMLEGLEESIAERRHPDRVSERASSTAAETAKQAAEPAARDVLGSVLDRANNTIFNRL